MATIPEFKRSSRHEYGYSCHYITYSVDDTDYRVMIIATDTGEDALYIETDAQHNVLPPPPFQKEAIEWYFKKTYKARPELSIARKVILKVWNEVLERETPDKDNGIDRLDFV